MEGPGAAAAAAAAAGPGPSNVPAFLSKLWTLVEDPETDALICWSPSGSSFHVFDQGQFSKEVLPKYFKHSNMASFVRQLNMYGFRKVLHLEQGGLVKPEKDDTEFQHPFFLRGQERLLENIKRKVTGVPPLRPEEARLRQDSVARLLADMHAMRGRQESLDSRLLTMKRENEALWREVAALRQKHAQQQKVVNKLIQFLISLVQSNRILGVKRKIPLLLNDAGSAHSGPKFGRAFPLEHRGNSPYGAPGPALLPADPGPARRIDDVTNDVITDVTNDVIARDVTTNDVTNDVIAELPPAGPAPSPGHSPPVRIKEEPASPAPSPRGEEPRNPGNAGNSGNSGNPGNPGSAETPLSPGTFIDSILRENDSGAAPGNGPEKFPEKCRSLACLDRSELSEHLDSVDSSLEKLQALLGSHGFSMDSALLDVSPEFPEFPEFPTFPARIPSLPGISWPEFPTFPMVPKLTTFPPGIPNIPGRNSQHSQNSQRSQRSCPEISKFLARIPNIPTRNPQNSQHSQPEFPTFPEFLEFSTFPPGIPNIPGTP
ncbi:heat shock factor protein 1 [Lonchura striata]